MKCATYILISLLLFGCTPEQNRIEQELATTEKELAGLPHIKVDTLVPTLGYMSAKMDSENDGGRITITFPKPKPIDTVVLVPANRLNEQNEYAVNRFPVRFKIEAQTENGELIRIADHTQSDFPCPGIAPTIFNAADGRPAKSLTLTVTKLPPWFLGEYLFMLNELLVFSDEENIALNATVSCESSHRRALRFDPAYLVDGYTYFPPFEPAPDDPHSNFRTHEEEVRIFFDLEEDRSLNEARFYPNDFLVQFSHIHSAAIGFPMEIELRLSPTPSFEHAEPIVISRSDQPINMSSSPLCKKFSPVTGRYVQIALRNGRMLPGVNEPLISLSEIELLNNGVNRLGGIPFRSAKPLELGQPVVISPDVLTDGNSVYGKIIPQKQWFLQLARRAKLEKKRARLLLEKETIYARQKKELRTLLFSIPFVALILLLFLLGIRYRNRQKIQQVRERIADDLHDEVGATLTGIANATELLQEIHPATSPKEKELLTRIAKNARRTASETRALIRFLEQKTTDSDLIEQFRGVIEQMLLGFSVKTEFDEAPRFNHLAPILKWDLLLLFKEALNNIIKHADADAIEIRTYREHHKLVLAITDNGKGLPGNRQPEHLVKRAQKMGAKITFETPETGGTTIRCTLSR